MSDTRLKVAIGLCSGDMVHTDMAMCLARMMMYTALKCTNISILGIINRKCSTIHAGRHECVVEALKLGADKLLFIDSDMMFPHDSLSKLVAGNVDIVGCDYMKRRAPYENTTRILRDNKEILAPLDSEGLKEVHRIGTGFLLVDMNVFKTIEEPYFLPGAEIIETGPQFIGEDYNFCDDARSKGFNVHCDFDLSKKIGHIGTIALYTQAFVQDNVKASDDKS